MSVRRAVRVLLVDPQHRLLLARFVSPDSGVVFWAPVGGGIEAGESAEQAAVREVAEETGLRDVRLGPLVFTRRVQFVWRGRTVDQAERWFVAYVPSFVPTDAGWTDDERTDMTELRWWTAPELTAAAEVLTPADLAGRFASLLADGPPAAPLTLGF